MSTTLAAYTDIGIHQSIGRTSKDQRRSQKVINHPDLCSEETPSIYDVIRTLRAGFGYRNRIRVIIYPHRHCSDERTIP